MPEIISALCTNNSDVKQASHLPLNLKLLHSNTYAREDSPSLGDTSVLKAARETQSFCSKPCCFAENSIYSRSLLQFLQSSKQNCLQTLANITQYRQVICRQNCFLWKKKGKHASPINTPVKLSLHTYPYTHMQVTNNNLFAYAFMQFQNAAKISLKS